MDYSMLLSPMKIGNLEIKNRTVMTAAEFSMGQANGKPTEKLMDYYEERAKGGVGLIIPLSFYNLYNQKNINSVYIGTNNKKYVLKGICMFPFMPSLTYTLKF